MQKGVPSNQVEYYAQTIRQHWRTATESVFTVCGLVAEAKDKLSRPDWELLKDDLPFSEGVLKKLICVGKDERLQRPEIKKLLPPTYSVLYEISKLSDSELQQALAEHEISLRMKRNDFIQWRKKIRATPEQHIRRPVPTKPRLGPEFFVGIILPNNFRTDRYQKIELDIDRLRRNHKLIVLDGNAGKELKAQARAKSAKRLRSDFAKEILPYKTKIDHDQIDLIESTFWQFEALREGKALPYSSDRADSIENPHHAFSIKRGWDFKRFREHVETQDILTAWSPIKETGDLGRAKCIQFAFQYLEAQTHAEQRKQKKSLLDIARRRGANALYANQYLAEIEGL